MKTLLILLGMAVSLVHAEATYYFGGGVTATNESFAVKNPSTELRETTSMLQTVQLKAGYGIRHGYAIEIDVGYGRYDKNIFSEADTDYIYFDLSLIKAMDFDIGVYPFVKLGFGVAELEIDRGMESSMSSGSFFGGAGLFVPIVGGLEVEANVVYRDKSWERLDMIGAQVKSTSALIEPYVGLNYRF